MAIPANIAGGMNLKRMMSRAIFLCGLCCLWVASLNGQPFIDLASAGFLQWHEPEEGNLNTTRLNSHLAMPVKLNKDVLVVGSAFEQYNFNAGQSVYGLSLPLAYVRTVNEKWKITGSLIPRISSDFENISSDDYQLGAALLLSRKRSETLTLKFGAFYNSEFFGFFMLPLAGIDWRVSPRLNVAGLLPRNMMVEYKWVPGKLHAGFLFRAFTNSFRTEPGQYLKVFDNQITAFADAYLLKSLVIRLEAGHSAFRKYEAGVRDHNEKIETDLGVGDDPLFRVSISYRLRLDTPAKSP